MCDTPVIMLPGEREREATPISQSFGCGTTVGLFSDWLPRLSSLSRCIRVLARAPSRPVLDSFRGSPHAAVLLAIISQGSTQTATAACSTKAAPGSANGVCWMSDAAKWAATTPSAGSAQELWMGCGAFRRTSVTLSGGTSTSAISIAECVEFRASVPALLSGWPPTK